MRKVSKIKGYKPANKELVFTLSARNCAATSNIHITYASYIKKS